jgi:uncharacterized C2H2 Zn-finger protein
MDRFTVTHLVDRTCIGRHCYSCETDEDHQNAYMVCPTCNHVFPTHEQFIADYLGLDLDYVKGMWDSLKKVVSLACPRCLHIWGDKGDK